MFDFRIYITFFRNSFVLTPCLQFALQKKEFDVDNLSKSELRMLLSVMEGELEARDVVIEALRVRTFWDCVLIIAWRAIGRGAFPLSF